MNIEKIFDLSGRVVIITGAAGLLGSEYAKGFSQAGANVVLADQNIVKCKKLAKILENKFNVSPLAIKTDVTNPESIKKMITKVMKKFSKIDVLVNNAIFPETEKNRKISFENFGIAASKGNDNTISASRYYMQKDEEKLILGDVISKLEITSEDELMDVGSNTGNLTIPLSFFVNNITAVDHAECLDKLNSRFPNLDNICLIPGDFMEVDIKKTFNKILIYSVLHYLVHI